MNSTETRTTPKGARSEYKPTDFDGSPTALLDYIAKWYPQPRMSQDLPGVPASRIPLESTAVLCELIANGSVVQVEQRGHVFYTVA